MPQTFFSPPPLSPASALLSPQSIRDDSSEDPFSAESDRAGGGSEDEGTRQNTAINSGNLQRITGDLSAMPANPFKKASTAESRPGPPIPGSEGLSIEAESKTTRPRYDVDDFKRLLLTGEKNVPGANATVPPLASFQSPAPVGDSSSNTDASSISRQSIFEPVTGPLQESPRSSHGSVSSDNERQRLVENIPTASESIKPSTPRHRHGKLVKTNAPQTVSFEDPTLSIVDSTKGTMAPVDRSILGSSGDVHKPLPPLPSAPNSQLVRQNSIGSTSSDMRDVHPEFEASPSGSIARKRSPPAPPLSRRHSQLRAKPFASSTERSMPITEEAPMISKLLSQSAPTASSKAPPPPPPRRAGLVRGNSSLSMSTGASSTLMSDQFNATDAGTRSANPRPPAPPNRSPSVSSANRSDQTQSIPGSPSMAPPPPARRRGSSQSSYTPSSRLSGYYAGRLRSDSGASSISHLAMTSVSSSGAESKDVMADLSALQREVDELRGKFKD